MQALAEVLGFGTTSKHHILFAELDLLEGMADAMGAGGAGRGDRIVQAPDAKETGQARRDRTGHGTRYTVRPDLAYTLAVQQLVGLDDVFAGAATRTHHAAGTGGGHLLGRQPRIGDGIGHGKVAIGCGIAHEAPVAPVDALKVDLQPAADMAAQPRLRIGRVEGDSRAPLAQCLEHLRWAVAQARDDAHAGHHHAT